MKQNKVNKTLPSKQTTGIWRWQLQRRISWGSTLDKKIKAAIRFVCTKITRRLTYQRSEFALGHVLGDEDKRNRAEWKIVTGVHSVPDSRREQSHSRSQSFEREAAINVGREPKLDGHVPVSEADAEVWFLGVQLVNVVNGFEINNIRIVGFPINDFIVVKR